MPYTLSIGKSMHIFCRQFWSTLVFIYPSLNQLIVHETFRVIVSGAKFSSKKFWYFTCNKKHTLVFWIPLQLRPTTIHSGFTKGYYNFQCLLHSSPLWQCLRAIEFTVHRQKVNVLFLFCFKFHQSSKAFSCPNRTLNNENMNYLHTVKSNITIFGQTLEQLEELFYSW